MLYLISGDVDNRRYYEKLSYDLNATNNYLRLFFAGKLKIYDILNDILSNESIDQRRYEIYMVTLTLADEMPKPMTQVEVMPYFFALQVNYHNSLGETRGRITSRYMASRVAVNCNWNFREFSGFDTQNFNIEYKTVRIDFVCLLQTIEFKLPVVQVEKGWFDTNFRKKNIGYMLNPSMDAPGYFTIDGNYSLSTYTIPKSIYMELFRDGMKQNGSYVLTSKDNLEEYVNPNSIYTVYTMLTMADFMDLFNVEDIDGEFWLDEDANLLIASRYQPKTSEDNYFIYWEEIRPNIYRLQYKHKFYVPFLDGNKIRILCNI